MLNGGLKKINRYFSSSAEETEQIGKKIAYMLAPKSIVCLIGCLGVGKTVLSKGIVAQRTGIENFHVNSPTFNYLHIYQGSETIYHFDCYRLKGSDDFIKRGFDEYFGHLCLIEWAEKIETIMPNDRSLIKMEYLGKRGKGYFL